MRSSVSSLGVGLFVWVSITANSIWAQSPFVFRDVGDEAGLFPAVAGIAGHGVGWGDVDGDGWPDLYVGTFGGHPYESKPNQLFLNRKVRFELDSQPQQVKANQRIAITK